jgi:hypothetical protein
MAEIDDK